MEGRYNMYSQGSSCWTSTKKEEFEEDDVWGVLRESKYSKSKVDNSKDLSTCNTPRRLPSAAKIIPRSNTNSSTHHEAITEIHQQSAPVNIPDWSRIYGKKHSNNDEDGFRRERWESDEEDEMIPPHEWIAKKLGRTQNLAFSVCEGAGRTLKGRDLRRVRNAILSKTGFLEQ